MTFDIKLDAADKIVEVIYKGVLSMAIRKEMLQAAGLHLVTSGYRRLIVDVLDTEFGDGEMLTDAFKVISFLRAVGIPPGSKLAFLTRDYNKRRRFFKDIAQSEGFDLNYFPTRQEALDWFSEAPPPKDTHFNR